jgi:hypothetical protein
MGYMLRLNGAGEVNGMGGMVTEIERGSTEPRWCSLALVRVHVGSARSEGGLLDRGSGRRYESVTDD